MGGDFWMAWIKLSQWLDNLDDAKHFVKTNLIEDYEVIILWQEEFEFDG